MTVATHIARTSRSISLPKWMLDLGIACALCIAVYATYLAMGLPTLFDAAGDSDSLLRLVEIRDLLGGQGWFDLHQYRMGADGGFVMHWSRLIDAPIAALILLASMLGFATPLAENRFPPPPPPPPMPRAPPSDRCSKTTPISARAIMR